MEKKSFLRRNSKGILLFILVVISILLSNVRVHAQQLESSQSIKFVVGCEPAYATSLMKGNIPPEGIAVPSGQVVLLDLMPNQFHQVGRYHRVLYLSDQHPTDFQEYQFKHFPIIEYPLVLSDGDFITFLKIETLPW